MPNPVAYFNSQAAGGSADQDGNNAANWWSDIGNTTPYGALPVTWASAVDGVLQEDCDFGAGGTAFDNLELGGHTMTGLTGLNSTGILSNGTKAGSICYIDGSPLGTIHANNVSFVSTENSNPSGGEYTTIDGPNNYFPTGGNYNVTNGSNATFFSGQTYNGNINVSTAYDITVGTFSGNVTCRDFSATNNGSVTCRNFSGDGSGSSTCSGDNSGTSTGATVCVNYTGSGNTGGVTCTTYTGSGSGGAICSNYTPNASSSGSVALTGVNQYITLDNFTGTYTHLDTPDSLHITFNSGLHIYLFPPAGYVDGLSWGEYNHLRSGTLVLPADTDVKDGVTYGVNGNGSTGTMPAGGGTRGYAS